MQFGRCSRKLPVGAAAVLLSIAGLSYAAKLKFEITDETIPGVDENGSAYFSADPPVSGEGDFKVSVNLKNGKFRAKVTGQAVNDSGKAHTFNNDPVLEEAVVDFFVGLGGVTVDLKRTKYKVAANGAAKGSGSGTTNFFDEF